jgi:hypothetical protein
MERRVESQSYKREEDLGGEVLIPSTSYICFTHILTTFLLSMALTLSTPAGLVELCQYSTSTGDFISCADACFHIMDAIEDPYPTNQDVRHLFSLWPVL